MTLVIAQKVSGNISLNSDSRISFGNLGHIDYGIKILPVPVKIFSPTSSETRTSTLDYNYKLGLAVVGSAINAYTVKESIYEILQNLQYVPGLTDVSMDGIASLVFKVFKKTTLDLGTIIQNSGICELLLAGFCPINNDIRIFKFSCDTSTYPINPFFNEILVNDGIEFFGSGKTKAEEIFNNDRSLTPLHILRKVINDTNVPTVGGGLQNGDFEDNNFKIYGIQDYSLNPDGTFKEYINTLRGINIYKDEFEHSEEGFHIAYTFKTPFEEEIEAIWKKQIGDL